MKRKIAFTIFILLILQISSDNINAYKETRLAYNVISQFDVANPPAFVILGDLQRTSFVEMIMGREQNDLERDLIVKEITKEKPLFTVLLGDMVFEGDSQKDWKYFDTLVYPLTSNKIALLPVLGNHEYWGNTLSGKSNIYSRFPHIENRHWYDQIYDSLALVFLDSNTPDMKRETWKKQQKWFEERLAMYDTSSAIKGVLVFAHHPPYTNSLVTSDEVTVQECFLPSFNKAKKTLAFITGHAHTYERFVVKGKQFIVSGGGGGPRVALNSNVGCHKDECKLPSKVRPFNYITADRNGEKLELLVKGLNKKEKDFFVIEKLSLDLFK